MKFNTGLCLIKCSKWLYVALKLYNIMFHKTNSVKINEYWNRLMTQQYDNKALEVQPNIENLLGCSYYGIFLIFKT